MGCGASAPRVRTPKPQVIQKPVSPSPDPSPSPPPPPSRPRSPSPLPPLAEPDIVEDFIIVWLDPSIDKNSKETQTIQQQLQEVVNAVEIYTDPRQCLAFIKSVKDEKIFLIISDTLVKQFVPKVEDLPQIDSIYHFCSKEETNDNQTNHISGVTGSYTSIKPLCQQLQKDIKKCGHDMVSYGFMGGSSSKITTKNNQYTIDDKSLEESPLKIVTNTNQRMANNESVGSSSSKTGTKNNQSSDTNENIEESSSKIRTTDNRQEALTIYDQLFREIVLTLNENDMNDIYDFCRRYYKTNPTESKFIDEIEKTYLDRTAIYWYTRDSCLYKILNKALRTHRYDRLFNMRVFIRHLHQNIDEQKKPTELEKIRLYRGQGVEKAEFERNPPQAGGLMYVSSFWSTSIDPKVALEFAEGARGDKKKVSVLFEIKIDKNASVSFANIGHLSAFPKEEEWLFSFGSIFRIDTVELQPNGTWHINLTSTNDNDEQQTALKEYFKDSIEDENVCLSVAKIAHQLAYWKQSQHLYLKSLQKENEWYRKSAIYNNLGLISSEQKEYEEALKYYYQSRDLEQEHGDPNSDLTSTYNNIGTLYYKREEMDLAIENFQLAIKTHDDAPNDNPEIMATLYNNIASILNYQGKHKQALKNNRKCLDIRIDIFPPFHPSLATAYNSIASTYYYQQLFAEAVKYAEKAVEIDNLVLPSDHPQTKIHMENLNRFKELASSKS